MNGKQLFNSSVTVTPSKWKVCRLLDLHITCGVTGGTPLLHRSQNDKVETMLKETRRLKTSNTSNKNSFESHRRLHD